MNCSQLPSSDLISNKNIECYRPALLLLPRRQLRAPSRIHVVLGPFVVKTQKKQQQILINGARCLLMEYGKSHCIFGEKVPRSWAIEIMELYYKLLASLIFHGQIIVGRVPSTDYGQYTDCTIQHDYIPSVRQHVTTSNIAFTYPFLTESRNSLFLGSSKDNRSPSSTV